LSVLSTKLNMNKQGRKCVIYVPGISNTIFNLVFR